MCADLHLLAAEDEAGSSGQSPDSRDTLRHGCPESDWDSDVSGTGSEGTSSEQCEHNVGGLQNVVEDHSGEKKISSWKTVNFEG